MNDDDGVGDSEEQVEDPVNQARNTLNEALQVLEVAVGSISGGMATIEIEPLLTWRSSMRSFWPHVHKDLTSIRESMVVINELLVHQILEPGQMRAILDPIKVIGECSQSVYYMVFYHRDNPINREAEAQILSGFGRLFEAMGRFRKANKLFRILVGLPIDPQDPLDVNFDFLSRLPEGYWIGRGDRRPC